MSGPHAPSRAPLLVVGGGAAAAWLLILLKRASGRLPPTIVVEPRAQLGLGVAYSATLDLHRLNVQAETMDMFPEPGVTGFADWAGLSHGYGPADYLPRSLYGRYLAELLDREMSGQPLEHRRATVTSIARAPQGYRIGLAGGDTVEAGTVVLALGNPRSRPLYAASADRVVEHPFGTALATQDTATDILVVGAGLTAIDAVLELDARRPGRRYTAVAPHPFFPPADAAVDPIDYPEGPYPPPSGLLHWAKSHRTAQRGALSWYAPVDGLRPHAGDIWLSWTPAQRSTFLRHTARYWLHLRHRAAPPAAAAIAGIVGQGRLEFRPGRASIAGIDTGGVRVRIGGIEARFDSVVNATGPDLDPLADPLLSGMVGQGDIRADPLGLGICVAPDGRVLGKGQPGHLFALGAWTRGSLWEIVAVPHIREAIRRMLPRLLNGPGIAPGRRAP